MGKEEWMTRLNAVKQKPYAEKYSINIDRLIANSEERR